MVKLGVNIDHVATVREARKTFEPDPVEAAEVCEKAGCDGIVCHLRKDRRHINDKDLEQIKEVVGTKLNLEMSVDPEIVDIACKAKPDQATLVPENRQEITTEGGLDVVGNLARIKEVVESLQKAGIEVSLFIDPEEDQVEASVEVGAGIIEFHTGKYAEEFASGGDHASELEVLKKMTEFGISRGLTVCAGHGLTYENVVPVARISGMHELNIGHSIISKSVFTGLGEAVRMMKELIS
ncbi:pyridoxine 5'-phosphate synthase [Candidatus Omnitrophota bacterium]